MKIKNIASFVKAAKELIKDEYYNVNADYPENNSDKIKKLTKDFQEIDLPEGNVSKAKNSLIDSLIKVADLSNRHYIYHDDLERRDREMNGCNEEDEEYLEQCVTNSKEDFESNRSELSNWVGNVSNDIDAFVAKVNEVRAEKSSDMVL